MTMKYEPNLFELNAMLRKLTEVEIEATSYKNVRGVHYTVLHCTLYTYNERYLFEWR